MRNLSKIFPAITALTILLVFAACNYSNKKGEPAGVQITAQDKAIYSTINEKIFSNYCVRCHNPTGQKCNGPCGGVNLDTYANVVKNISKVKSEVEDDSMPPSRPLSQSEKAFLSAWVDAGMPVSSDTSPAPSPTPKPSPTPVPAPAPAPGPNPKPPPTFSRVYTAVFATSCTTCHGVAGGNKHGLNLETYQNIKGALTEALDEISTDDMPLPPKAPLTDEQKTLLKAWVDAGALDDSEPARNLGNVMKDMATEYKIISAQTEKAEENKDTIQHLVAFEKLVGEASNLTPQKLGDGKSAENEASVLEYKKLIASLDQLSLSLKDELEKGDNVGAIAVQKQISDLKVQGHALFK